MNESPEELLAFVERVKEEGTGMEPHPLLLVDLASALSTALAALEKWKRIAEDMQAWQAAHRDPVHDLIVADSKLAALESRYSALVTAAKNVLWEINYGGSGDQWLARRAKSWWKSTLADALGALLDSEASDQGVSDG